jgi:hypothetical protein
MTEVLSSTQSADDAEAYGRMQYMHAAAEIEEKIKKICPEYSFSFDLESEFGLGVDLVNGRDIFGLGRTQTVKVESVNASISEKVQDIVPEEEIIEVAVVAETDLEEECVDLDTSVDEIVHEISRKSVDGLPVTVNVRTQLEAWLRVGAADVSNEQQKRTVEDSSTVEVESQNVSGVLQESIALDSSDTSAHASTSAISISTVVETQQSQELEGVETGQVESVSEEEKKELIRDEMLEQLRAEEQWLESAIWQRLHSLRS